MDLPISALEQDVLRLPWRAVLSHPLVRHTDLARRPLHSAVAAVPYLGTWSGWLTVRVDVHLIGEIAERMRHPDLVRSCDLDDAMRWLATTLAHGLQSTLDAGSRIGPASVLEPTQPWTPRWCRPAARLLFASGERLLGLALDERIPVVVRESGMFDSDLDDAVVRERDTSEYPMQPRPPLSRRRVF